jgi:uncharacterized protein (TIGR00369 family)
MGTMGIDELNRICKGTLIDLLHMKFTGYTGHSVEALMEIRPDLYQPAGVVHGGALISLAETVGSAGSFLLVDQEKFDVFGSSVNSQHISPAREGVLHARAELIVKSEFKHVWDVQITDDKDKLISISRVTTSIKPKKNNG